MRLETDVLIAGLGPAGGAAALAAAQGGLSVAVVERRQEIGIPVQCAEWIPLQLGRHAQAPGVLVQAIAGMASVLPSGAVTHSDTPGLMVERAAFDQALADAAGRAGARLHLHSTLRRLDPARSRAWIDTPEGPREYVYKVLIAADGPYSTVARQLGLPRQAVVHARQYTVPLMRAAAETTVWLSGAYPGGYAWLFPKGEVANLGVGMDKRFSVDLKTPLEKLHRQLVAENIVGQTILGRTGGVIPVGGLRTDLTLGNIMLVGDAGGFTHPVTGAGIYAAVVSGERAGLAAVAWQRGDAGALAAFEGDMRDQFAVSLQRAVERRAELVSSAHHEADLRRGWVAFPEYFE